MTPENLQDVLDAVLEGVVVVDDAGAIARLNDEACRILEISAEHASGSRLETIVGGEHRVATLAEQVRRNGRAAIADGVPLPRRYGSELEIDVAVSPLGDGLLVAMRDLTLRRSLSERVEQREQLARYGHIAAGIAHEVKNPLGGIRGAAELIGHWSEDERARNASALITREVDRITALVDELMVFARGDRLKMESVNLHRVIDGVLELLGMDPLSAGRDLERNYDPSIPDLPADPDRLTQVFLNLARNALQAMEETGGGTLSITTRVSLGERLVNSTGRPIPTISVLFNDTGPGIAPDVLERLATPFFTTRTEGVGLGLAVARHWVTRHGGTLRISSQLGEGTTARVDLPLHGVDHAPEAM